MALNKYQPHQGAQEIERRRNQILRGIRMPFVLAPKTGLVRSDRRDVETPRRKYVVTDCVKVVAKRDRYTGAVTGVKREVFGQRLERSVPKVKGKANVKKAKRARIRGRRAETRSVAA